MRLGAFLALTLATTIAAAPAFSRCETVSGRPVATHVVAVEGSGPLKDLRSGLLVTENGMILSVLNPVEPGITGAGMLELDVNQLAVKVRTEATEQTGGVNGVIFGHDWRRNLLVIKIAEEDVSRLGLAPISLATLPSGGRGEVCVVAFRKQDGKLRLTDTDRVERQSGHDIRWNLRYTAHLTELGGAVIDPASGSLLGILVNAEGSTTTRFLPIEYADTLMSQVFIARIMKQMDEMTDTFEDLQTAVGWHYQVVRQTGGNLTIRFFFEQYARGPVVDKVLISTKLKGTAAGGDPGQDVTLPDPRSDPIFVRPGATSVDYLADRFISAAADLGFTHLDTLAVTLYVKFRSPEGMPALESPRTTLEIPIDIQPQPDR